MFLRRSFVFLLLFVRIGAAAQVQSNFSVDADGWTVFNTSTGGSSSVIYNAGGYIDFTVPNTSVAYVFSAPAKFLGNHTTSYNQNLNFDLKVSTAGTDNSAGDLIINSPGLSLYFQLASKPGTSFTSYTAKLNETVAGWHVGGVAGAAPTQTQMKQVLSNITSMTIRLKYTTASASTGSLDNVVLNVQNSGSAPVISSFTPASGIPGTTVTIAGNNFGSAINQNVVMFNGSRAVVTSATPTQLIVTTPVSTPWGQITVENLATGLSGSSTTSFSPLFDNNKDFGGRIINASGTPGYKNLIGMGNNDNRFGGIDKGDIDGDGAIDLIVTETSTLKIFAYRNLKTGNPLSASTFSTPITLTLTGIPGTAQGLGEIALADMDSDGLLDVVASVSSSASAFIAVYQNTSVSGAISFALPKFFVFAYYAAGPITIADLDGDGKKDVMCTNGTSPSGLWINQNLSTPGNIDMGYGYSISATGSFSDLVAGDMNGDGKPEIIACGYNGNTFSVFTNNSSPGSINMNNPFTYTPATNLFNAQICLGDLDGDGKLDLAWSANAAQFLYISQNIYNGTTFNAGSFSGEITIANTVDNPNGLAISDFNADGKVDIVVVGTYDAGVFENVGSAGSIFNNSFLTNSLFKGSQSGTFLNYFAPAVADYDGDNKPDIATVYSNNAATATEKGVYLFRNEHYPAPVISSMPSSGSTGNFITASGNSLNTNFTAPKFRLGAIPTTTGSVSNTATDVKIPTGGESGKISVTIHGLTDYSKQFNVAFGTPRIINSSSFGPNVDFAMAAGPKDALLIADFDDDGKADVAVADGSGAKIFQNTATAGAPITTSSLTLVGTPYSNFGANMAVLDIDGDGKIDLHNGTGLLQNTSSPGAITFASGPGGVSTSVSNFTSITPGDFNFDGKIDLAITNGSANVLVYENQSINGVFVNNGKYSTYNPNSVNFSRTYSGGGIVADDFDRDGFDDIIITEYGTTSGYGAYLSQQKYGPITPQSLLFWGTSSLAGGTGPKEIRSADLDGDGYADMAIVFAASSNVSALLNNSVVGDISFQELVLTTPVGSGTGYNLALQDLDGDKLPEIISVHKFAVAAGGTIVIFKNTSTPGNLNFAAGVAISLGNTPTGVAAADVNLDGKPDLLVVGSGGTGNKLMVFENKMTSINISITQQPLDQTVCPGLTAAYTTAATGTTNITYQWQFSPDGIVPYADISNSGGYAGTNTSSLSVNTAGNFGLGRYRCRINGDNAVEVITNNEGLFFATVPSVPGTTGASGCSGTSITLTASGASNGQYRWYTQSSGGTAIAGEVNATYTTPVLTTTTTFYVSINNGTCEGGRNAVTATVTTCPANQPPVIVPTPVTTTVGAVAIVDLTPWVSDPDNNIDLNSLSIVTPPSSGATATITSGHQLRIDYTGLSFAGTDKLTIKVCDLLGSCTTSQISVEVAGNITVYNAVSPNGDGSNDIFFIENIDLLPDTQHNKVLIFNRWGDVVFETQDYNNTTRVFKGLNNNGNELPSGTYYYRIDYFSGTPSQTGFISLKR